MSSSKTKEDVLLGAAIFALGSLISTMVTRKLSTYKPPKVWTFKEQGGNFGKINRPTAGARKEQELTRGKHALQLYSLGTPNGAKITTLLEELHLRYGVEYDAYLIDISKGDQFTSGFVAANPNSKIPALLDYEGTDDSEPIRVFETAAIMLYLCEKYDKENIFLPRVGHPRRAECLSWLMWTQGSAPFLGGGFGHFYNYAPIKIEYAIDRYSMEVKRQFDVLNRHFADGRSYLCGEQLTIADLACWPWYGSLALGKLYGEAATFLQLEEYTHVLAWAKRVGERQGVIRGAKVNRSWGPPKDQLKERHSASDFDMTEEQSNE